MDPNGSAAAPPQHGMMTGNVVDNRDPKRLGRVKVNIPGIATPTGWAFPLGWPASGGKKRGTFAPPPKDAEVAVFFKLGDPDHPYYICGHPGEGEAPDEVEQAADEDDATKVYKYEGERWIFLLDERKGKHRAAIIDKKTDDIIEIDGVKLGVHIKATTAMSIECTGAVDIKGGSVTINGRKVAPSTKAI